MPEGDPGAGAGSGLVEDPLQGVAGSAGEDAILVREGELAVESLAIPVIVKIDEDKWN